ncbi:MAG: CHASE3 domain-containing protein [Proteobacteria bacterium]|nr:CHASE3 domain-containing protein [Pseudomonadota bacterium]
MLRFNTTRNFAALFSGSATRTLLIWVAVAILSGLAAIVAWRWTVKAADRVTHTLIVQQELTKWLSAAQDLQNGQLGYLLTKDSRFLKPYEAAKGSVVLIHNDLIRLVGGHVAQAALMQAIHETMKEQIAAIEKTLATAGGADFSSQAFVDDSGIEIMDRLRNQISAAKQQEQILFNQRLRQFQSQSSWLLAAMLATLLACAALALVALIRERQRVAALELTALTLRSTNRSLEERVNARTEELAIERDRAEAERERAEALLRDVTHRIGNTLALVVGFINLHIRHTSDPKSLKTLTGARDRIHAIASAQRRINVVNDLELVRIDTLIRAVLDDVVEAAGEDRILLSVDVPPLLASAQVATSLCVLTQEFVVNSFKHAFGENDTGQVSVCLKRNGPAGAELVVEDDGSGWEGALDQMAGAEKAASDPEHPSEGLGTKIAALLTRQFSGTISYEQARPGSVRPGTRVMIRLSELILSDPDSIPEKSREEVSPSAL